MNKTLWAALVECQECSSRGYPFYFRTASMKKLEALGYVESVPNVQYANAFKVTALGEDALTKYHTQKDVAA